jgi:hypothetical protein
VVCSDEVSSGGITEIPEAVVQPALEDIPWVTPTRNDMLLCGATISASSGAAPKKSCVVRVVAVGSGRPDPSRNWIPGNPYVRQGWEVALVSSNPSRPCPVAP